VPKPIRLVSTAYGAPWVGIQGTGVTATGIDLRKHPKQYVVAVDPSVIPLGSKLKIPHNPFGDPNIVFTAADTGGAIKGNRLDFYDWRGRKAQMGWGTRPIEAQIVGSGGRPQTPGSGAQGAVGGTGPEFLPGTSSSGFSDTGGGADLASIIQSMMQPAARPSSAGLADPGFSARKSLPLPAGYQGVQSSGGPAPPADVGSIIRDLLPTLGGGDIPKAASPGLLIPGMPGSSGGGGGKVRGTLGQLIGKPLDRPGTSTSPEIIRFARRVAGVLHSPISVGTGTAHNEFVKGTHRVSAHWSGNALDLPATGARLTRMGHAALIAAGMPAAEARRQTGGVFNVGGYQVIFNTTEGGNHFNHLHVGLRR
jgi:3D (Asp-Asp-Asp) domain-containing protein